MIALRVYVDGVVQGVGFRAYTKRVADSYGLAGFVKNLPDGRVEVFVQGDEDVLWAFLRDLWRGPRLSEVSSMQIFKEVPSHEERDFRIAY